VESVASVRGMIPTSKQRRTDLYSVLDRSKGEARVNCDHRMDERKVTDTIKVEDLGAKTVLCRCWKSNKFPLCDGAHGRHNQKCGDNLGPVILTKTN